MLLISQHADKDAVAQHYLTLTFDLRQKARLRVSLDSGEEVGLQLERGRILRGGDKLLAEDGSVIEVIAATETVSTVSCVNPRLLGRICYHLGNRHVPLQVIDADPDAVNNSINNDVNRNTNNNVKSNNSKKNSAQPQYQCRYAHDHVLDEMVALLGGDVICEQAPFEPESGAYASSEMPHTHHSHSEHDESHSHVHTNMHSDS